MALLVLLTISTCSGDYYAPVKKKETEDPRCEVFYWRFHHSIKVAALGFICDSKSHTTKYFAWAFTLLTFTTTARQTLLPPLNSGKKTKQNVFSSRFSRPSFVPVLYLVHSSNKAPSTAQYNDLFTWLSSWDLLEKDKILFIFVFLELWRYLLNEWINQ